MPGEPTCAFHRPQPAGPPRWQWIADRGQGLAEARYTYVVNVEPDPDTDGHDIFAATSRSWAETYRAYLLEHLGDHEWVARYEAGQLTAAERAEVLGWHPNASGMTAEQIAAARAWRPGQTLPRKREPMSERPPASLISDDAPRPDPNELITFETVDGETLTMPRWQMEAEYEDE